MEKAGDDRDNGMGKLAGDGMASEFQGNRMVVGGAIGKVASHATSQAKWTFLVYMAGDNNLDGAALRDIAEMARAGSTKDVNILVQLDRIEDNLTRRFRITQGGGFKKDCIQTFGDTNTGDPQILYEFVKWAADNYSADRYALILWNHGSGWWEDAKSRATGPAAKKPRRRLFRQPVRYPVPQEHLKIPVPQAHRSICYDDTSGGDALDNRERRIVLAGICALLGRMLGDVGSYWQIVVGLVLIWVALGMLGVEKCNLSGSRLHRLNVKGLRGAFLLGLAYGVLSGSCTFGFIAPILAIITVQQKVLTGVLLSLIFALGHCIPIMIAGSSTAAVRRLTENETWIGSGGWFRKSAGVVIGLLGIYFIGSPFVIG